MNVCSEHKSDGIFIITSGKISSGVKRTFQSFTEDISHRYRSIWWERNDLVIHLEKYQDVLKKYFLKYK